MTSKQKLQLIEMSEKTDYHTKEISFNEIHQQLSSYSDNQLLKSRLEREYIEGILLGFPLPTLLCKTINNKKNYLSNHNKLMTIVRFINDRFCLKNLKFLTTFDQIYFSDLSSSNQTRFLNRHFSVRMLETDKLPFDLITSEIVEQHFAQQ